MIGAIGGYAASFQFTLGPTPVAEGLARQERTGAESAAIRDVATRPGPELTAAPWLAAELEQAESDPADRGGLGQGDRAGADRQGSSGAEAASAKGADGKPLSDDEQDEVEELQKRDREVKAHEQAHVAAGGQYAAGGAAYSYTVGPDGRQYATGGSVGIDASPVKGDPEATVKKAQVVRRAALAPADPSPQDRLVAARAAQMEAQARTQKAEAERPAASGEATGAAGDATGAAEGADGSGPAMGVDVGGTARNAKNDRVGNGGEAAVAAEATGSSNAGPDRLDRIRSRSAARVYAGRSAAPDDPAGADTVATARLDMAV